MNSTSTTWESINNCITNATSYLIRTLLADVFENFRDESMKNYKLDPAWYYRSPSLAWDAMLKYTDITLNLLVDGDIDMLLINV